MWTSPSLPGRISTKAPKFMIRVTLPMYSLPTSTSLVRPSIQAIAFWAASPLVAAIWIVPSSSMLISVPVSAVIWRMTLPPAPMTSRILSTGILIVVMRGAYGLSSSRLGADDLGHLAEDVHPGVVRLLERVAHDLGGDPGDLDVHLERRDALGGAGHLEVHVAVGVFLAGDVGEDGVAAGLRIGDQAHRRAARPAP